MTGTLQLFFYDMYCFLDLGSTLSYVTLFVDVYFGFNYEVILDPSSISTSIGDSLVAKRVYKGYMVVVGSRQTVVDFFKLDMVDFDDILGMDWTLLLCVLRLSDP